MGTYRPLLGIHCRLYISLNISSESYPELTGDPILSKPIVHDGDFHFECTVDYDDVADARYETRFLLDGADSGLAPVHLAYPNKTIIMPSTALVGRIGRSVSLHPMLILKLIEEYCVQYECHLIVNYINLLSVR